MIVEPMFTQEGDAFIPHPHTDSGWPVPTMHGGAVAGLLAHALESQRDEQALMPARLMVDLLKPVPRAPLRVTTSVVRSSRRIKLVDAVLLQGDTVLVRASALFLRREEGGQSEALGTSAVIPPMESVPPLHWAKGAPIAIFHHLAEVRRVNDWHRNEPLIAWARFPAPLLPGKPLTPFERSAVLSDFANVMGTLTQTDEAKGFINADITLRLVREPVGEWMCIEVVARADSGGIALSSVHLYDQQGFVGHAAVTCIENRLPDRVMPEVLRAQGL